MKQAKRVNSNMEITQLALDLETQVWKAVVQKDGAALNRLFDDNYIEITLEGQRVEKAEVVASSPQIDDIDAYKIESPKVVSFDGNTLLLRLIELQDEHNDLSYQELSSLASS